MVVTDRSKAGTSRKRVRDGFNLTEIEIAQIFDEYDVDGSGELDMDEFGQLIEDFIGCENADAVVWLKKVADKNVDDLISRSELMEAMQAWHGYTYLSEELPDIFDKYDIMRGNDVEDAELKQLLEELNDGMLVDPGAVDFVKKKARAFAEGYRMDRDDVLGAVGAWYMCVMRKSTPQSSVMIAGSGSPWRRLGVCIIFFFVIVWAGACIYYGNWEYLDTPTKCWETLRTQLFRTGSLSLIWAVLSLFMYFGGGTSAPVIALWALSGFAAGVYCFLGVLETRRASGYRDDVDPLSCQNGISGSPRDLLLSLFLFPLVLTFLFLFCLCCLVTFVSDDASAYERELQGEAHSRRRALKNIEGCWSPAADTRTPKSYTRLPPQDSIV